MKRLTNFNDYMLNLIIESVNNGNLPVKISKKLMDILEQIDHRIANYIASLDDEPQPITLIDISDENDKFTISNSPKIIEFLSSHYNRSNITDNDFYGYEQEYDDIWKKYRNKIKIGKFIKKMFGDKFPDSGSKGNDIESFVNKYKSLYEIINNKEDLFEIVEGNDIIKWYDFDNYIENISDSPLHNSCMAEGCEDYLNFYEKNTDKVKLLIQYKDSNKNKIIGRALIWYLDEPKRIFMDRIYYTMDHQVDTFKSYAKKNGWLYKNSQSHFEQDVIDSQTSELIDNSDFYLKNIKSNRYYPYMDTFKYYYQDHKILSLNLENLSESPLYLREVDGVPSNAYWSDFYNKYINEGDSTYIACGLLTDWDDVDEIDYINNKFRLKKDATYFKYYDDYAPNDRFKESDVVETTHGVSYKIFKDDAIWLKHYNAYTTEDYAINKMKYSNYYKDYIDIKDYVTSYDNDNIFKDKAIPVYKTKTDAKFGSNVLDIFFVPEEEIDNVAYKINNNYIFKKGVLKNEN